MGKNVDDRFFANRKDAGIQLGKLLEEEYKGRDIIVLAIPRGGIETGFYVAEILNGELCVVVSKKLPFPGQEELAFGAIAEDGSVYLSDLGEKVDDGSIDRIVEEQLEEINRRIKTYRNNKPLPDMADRVVIIVDDGIATGSTIVPVLKLCHEKKASKIVVAAPVSGKRYVKEINELADEVAIVVQPENFYAVGQVYEDFRGLEDEEVLDILRRYEKNRSDKDRRKH